MTITSKVSITQSRRMLGVLASIAAGVALLSGAGMSQAATTAAGVDIRGAYAYDDTLTSNHKEVRVVFRTSKALPRRGKSGVSATAGLDGPRIAARSVVFPTKGASAHCYEFTAEIKNGRIVTRDDVVDKSAKLGSKHKLTVTAFGNDGDRSNDVSDVTTLKVIAKSARVEARERIGC